MADTNKTPVFPTTEQLKRELERRNFGKKYISTLMSTFGAILVAVAAIALISVFFLPVFRVSGESMSPLLKSHDVVLCGKSSEVSQGDKLAELPSPLSDYANVSGYENVLDITGTGIMGYITIPKINVYLPIYHGTSPEVLNIAVGHLQGSTLPIGGTSRHSVISAHRGLPSSKLFTDIDQLVEDDTFTITILDEIYTYSVDNIEVVLPTELNSLNIIPDQDNVTLMTCTPYGINTHRLLVRAHRIDTYKPHEVRVPADAVPIDKMNCIPFIVAAVIILLILFWVIQGRMTRRFGLAEQFENSQHIPHNNKKG